MKLNKSIEYNYVGPCLTISTTIQLKYEDYEVFELPTSCTSCPVGFCSTSCGRNVPLKTEDYRSRPETCKLKKVNIEKAVSKFLEELENTDLFNKNKM